MCVLTGTCVLNERLTTTVERTRALTHYSFLLLLHVRAAISSRTLCFNKDKKKTFKRESSATNETLRRIGLVMFVEILHEL